MTDEPPSESTIWVRTEPTRKGNGYVVVVDVTDDRSLRFTPREALMWCQAVLGAVALAEYDVAVTRQMTSGLGLPLEPVAMLISEIRGDRPPLPTVRGLEIGYGVARDEHADGATYRPFITLHLDGEGVAQLTVEQGRHHALAMIEVPIVADLDSAYARALVGIVGIERDQATRAVHDLASYRDALPESP